MEDSLGDWLKSRLYTVTALTMSFTLVLILISLLTGVGLIEVLNAFLSSSVGSTNSLLRTLSRTTPLLISTLGLLIAFRSGVWNIGGEGQIVMGVVVSTGICLFLPLPHTLATFSALVVGFMAGGGYGAFAGFLKARWGINEVVITMMQNFVALALLKYLIDRPWNWGIGLYPRTALIPEATRLPFIIKPLNVTFALALALVYVCHLVIEGTVMGYRFRAMGVNPKAAYCYGIDTPALTMISMLLSGGLCGLAGSALVLGQFFRAQAGISGNYGFYSIASAFIAGNKPHLAPLSSLLVAFIYEGTIGLTAIGVPQSLREAIIGMIFLIVLLPKEIDLLKGTDGD